MFDIVFRHPEFIVINKYPDVSVHKDDNDVGLVQCVSAALDQKPLYLVHRLDKMTSGLLLLARNSEAAAVLSQKFARREMEKYYLALGSAKPRKKQGLICGDMSRTRRSAWKLLSSRNHPAVTQFLSQAAEPGIRLYLCKPHTGKTHQIRVALKSVGAPILGDPIYFPSDHRDRGYLHAYAIRFDFNQAHFEFVCNPVEGPYPGELWQSTAIRTAINAWQTPWTLDWPVLPFSTESTDKL